MGEYDYLIDRLPHRPPALFVDEVLELDPGRSIRGAVSFPVGHRVFENHLPGEPLVPGVVLIEAMAQVAGLVFAVGTGEGDPESVRGYLAEVRQMRFRRPVVPDSRVELVASLERIFGPAARFETEALVDGEIVAEGVITIVRSPRGSVESENSAD